MQTAYKKSGFVGNLESGEDHQTTLNGLVANLNIRRGDRLLCEAIKYSADKPSCMILLTREWALTLHEAEVLFFDATYFPLRTGPMPVLTLLSRVVTPEGAHIRPVAIATHDESKETCSVFMRQVVRFAEEATGVTVRQVDGQFLLRNLSCTFCPWPRT
jgi:hypothetical protein